MNNDTRCIGIDFRLRKHSSIISNYQVTQFPRDFERIFLTGNLSKLKIKQCNNLP